MLALKPNDVVDTLLPRLVVVISWAASDEWVYCINGNGDEGAVPSHYLEVEGREVVTEVMAGTFGVHGVV